MTVAEAMLYVGITGVVLAPLVQSIFESMNRRARLERAELQRKLRQAEELAAMLYGIAVKSSDAEAAEVARTVTQRMGYHIGAVAGKDAARSTVGKDAQQDAFEWIIGKWYRQRDGWRVYCESTNYGQRYPVRMSNGVTYTLEGEALRGDSTDRDDIVAGPFDTEEEARNG